MTQTRHGWRGLHPDRMQLPFYAAVIPRFASSTATPQQQPLPRLPVPPLQQTLEKYLRTVEPLVTTAEFETTKKCVRNFGSPGGIGDKLQEILMKKAEKTENWLADWWLQHSYLGFRWPVVVYSSPGMVMPRMKLRSSEDRFLMAAQVILAALDYKIAVDEGKLPLETMGKLPLDMSQHGKMLGTCRIPGMECDQLVFAPEGPGSPRHVIVAHNNHFFKVDVYDHNGNPYSEEVLIELLKDVLVRSPQPAVPVGILTTENRNIWGKVYQELRRNEKNAESLSTIQKSLFLVCIDAPNANDNLNPETRAALQMIHGGGAGLNGGNRWYDKTVQFVIGTDGEVGISYEHSPAEGPPIANLSDHAVDFLTEGRKAIRCSGQHKADTMPVLLEFELNDAVKLSIEEAKQHLKNIVDDLDMSCFTFQPFGKNFIKSQKLSPDSFIQMAFQLAFYRVHGILGTTYETASTRQYIHGRTETIRSASLESLKFCETMLKTASSVEDKTKSLHFAINAHKQYVMEAVKGHGVDRHLLGLKLVALENGFAIPKLYEDYGYTKSSQFRISTSQVAARHRSFMCYGPLVPDGYGCCYNPRDDDIIFGVSAFNSCKETSALKFHEAIHHSLVDMHNVLLQGQRSKL